MIDITRLKHILEGYKKYFPEHWDGESGEKYKWEAVYTFQKYWNIDADDYEDMIRQALSKTKNLLASGYAYPREMIFNFAKADPEATRTMFRDLYDESQDLAERIEAFLSASENMRVKYDDGTWRSHYQNTNAVTTYLWLRYPDKYYIYKYELFRTAARELSADYTPKKTGSADSVIGGFKMYDEICEAIKADEEICDMVKNAISDGYYPDPEMKTVTIDVGFYLARYYLNEQQTSLEDNKWYPSDEEYSPELSKEDWEELIEDGSVFTNSSLAILKRLKDYGGAATCKQLSVKYGENPNFYNGGSWSLAQRVAKKTGCPVMVKDNDNSKWWPILYRGRKADKSTDGAYVWKIRDELSDALDEFDLSDIPLYVDETPTIWKISHGSISEDNRIVFEERKVAVMHSTTRAKAGAKVSQGEMFMGRIKKGDFFYLCYGNSVRLLGQFTTNEASLNPEIKDGWYEREYSVIAQSKDTSPYKGVHKWWSPNDNSTCIEVEEKDRELFEEAILEPYFDMSLNKLFGSDNESVGYWWVTANPKIWSFSDLKVGEEQFYTLYNDNGNKRRIFQNFLDARTGDIVIGYESNPVKQVVALGRVSQENDGKVICFEKTEALTSPIDYLDLKACPELEKMEFFTQQNGSLFKLTKGEYEFIMDIIRENNPLQLKETTQVYSKEDFLKSVYMSEERYDVLKALLINKKNVILQGAPGVGKTFTARRLAYSMMGEVDESRVELIQFHQNYSYEDFIMGYRPNGSEFKLKDGMFYTFCRTAENNPDKDYFFIIDEINRGNLSKIFGEVLMLIEKDYRGTKATLAYNGMKFSIPENLYLIGMMNTADRSLAMIDYALRRRFSFFEMEPGFNSEGFTNYQSKLNNDTFNMLIEKIKVLNKEITEDNSLGRGFQIGHSYFCGREELGCTDEWMRSVVEFDILPMLSEYWFDEPEKLSKWTNELHGVFDD